MVKCYAPWYITVICKTRQNYQVLIIYIDMFINIASLQVEVEKALTLTRVKGIGYKIADVSLGPTHTAVLTKSGHVITFGRNAEGQLGRGHLRSSSSGPLIVKSMADKVATVSSVE
jgi:alpha-tubulin suppressor-like RCC1 family protein